MTDWPVPARLGSSRALSRPPSGRGAAGRGLGREPVRRCACLAALLLVACTAPASEPPSPRLLPISLPDRESPVLLRPRGLTTDDAGSVWVVEEGRQAVTLVDAAAQRLIRRPLWPGRLPEGISARPGAFFGAVLARAPDALYTIAPGLGPLRVPDGDGAPELLGAGTRGQAPAGGSPVALSDLSDVRGLAWDGEALVLAVGNDLWRVVGDTLAAIPVDLGPGHAGLGLGPVVGLAADEQGRLFATDAASGRIWRIAAEGAAEPVAGRGGDPDPPTEPGAALARTLELGLDHLVYDAAHQELTVLAGGREIWRVHLDDGGAHTIERLRTVQRFPGGLALTSEGELVISGLDGAVTRRPREGDEVVLWAAATEPLGLARAAGVAAVGLNAVLIADPAQRQLALQVPGEGLFRLWRETAPTSSQPGPVSGDQSGQVYFVTSLGLQWLDLVGGVGQRVAQRQPEVIVDGQHITAVVLPDAGELRSDGAGTAWLLDQDLRIVVRFDEQTGSAAHVAGTMRGGGQPRGSVTNPARQLQLRGPHHLVAGRDAVLLADATGADGGVVYAVNIAADPLELAGRNIPPDDAAHLGGGGDAAWADGEAFESVRLEAITALARDGAGLWVAASQSDAPALFRVTAEGLVDGVADPPSEPPDAIAVFGPDIVLLGWADAPGVEALNDGESAVTVLGVEVGPGLRSPVAALGDGVRDLVPGEDGFFALLADGGIVAQGESTSSLLGEVVGAQTLAVTGEGAVLAFDAGAIWGVRAGGEASFLGEPLPEPPAEVIVDPLVGFPPDTRVANLPFGPDVLAMASDSLGALYWIDGSTRSLYRATVTEALHVEGISPVELLGRGQPVPDDLPATLAAGADTVLMGDGERVYRLSDGGWPVLAGGGSAAPAVGLFADEVGLNDIYGLAVVGDAVWLRSRQGLIAVDGDGLITRVVPSLATDPADAAAVAYAQTLAAVEGELVLVLAGGVYRLVP